MNIYEVFFLVGFLCMAIMVIIKLYNVLKNCDWIEWQHSFLIFVGAFILWFITMVAAMSNVSNANIIGFLNFSTFLFRLIVLLSVVEFFLHLGKFWQKKVRDLGLNRGRYVPQTKDNLS